MTTYTRDEVFRASLDYFEGDELAADVFVNKYALRDESGALLELTPTDMHHRLAREFCRIERKYANPMSEDEIFALLSDWRVVPQGSPMSAIGNPYQVQSLSNCFVIDSPADSYGGIFKADQEEAQIMKRRGGVGLDISTLRPRGMSTANAARTSDGIAVFMERFSNTCREVAQGGRRGALMISISVHHPDIRTFINIKRDLKKVTGANISIRLSDEFMRAVRDDTTVQLRFPVDPDARHRITSDVNARELWHEIITAAHASGEPGLLFWDTVIRRSPADSYASKGFRTKSTNPCGELPLPPGDSCRLLLVNLTKFVKDPYTPNATFDVVGFKAVTEKAQRLMDDIVDLEIEMIDRILKKIDSDPEEEIVKMIEHNLWTTIKKMVTDGRRTGLGVTGLGDAIASLNMMYGSDESIAFTEDTYKELALSAYVSSVKMAKERGAFPIFDAETEKDSEFVSQVYRHSPMFATGFDMFGRRNIALLTTAPAGSVSILTRTTSGCEPAYKLIYKRRRKVMDPADRCDFIDETGDRWQEYTVLHPGLERWMNATGKTMSDIAVSPYHLATSVDINWEKKIELQAAAQKWIDHSISNTTNMPNAVTVEDVKRVYERGWELGCKGVTVYREGSRSGVLVSVDEDKAGIESIIETVAPKRPKELPCDIIRATVQGQSYLVLVGLYNDRPYEVFAGLSEHIAVPRKFKNGFIVKNGKNALGTVTYNLRIPIDDDGDELQFKDIVSMFENSTYGSFTRTISLALRHGVPVKFLVEQLRKDKHSDITSFSSVIARVLSKGYIPDGTKTVGQTCPSCGNSDLSYQQGCVGCTCGWMKCG